MSGNPNKIRFCDEEYSEDDVQRIKQYHKNKQHIQKAFQLIEEYHVLKNRYSDIKTLSLIEDRKDNALYNGIPIKTRFENEQDYQLLEFIKLQEQGYKNMFKELFAISGMKMFLFSRYGIELSDQEIKQRDTNTNLFESFLFNLQKQHIVLDVEKTVTLSSEHIVKVLVS